ncbi:carbohydrate ABC transporter permease [Caproicibacter fermentans]|uniref:Sugar ABC transporter permease n=1 Tax=Caproicibacter fermentans TaxID=2576756 RepID=A0A7G8TFB8_9FIRM|nr:sugar ABC transporter permease [Caproicibacter fermentans]QNK42309.1 sugar ABC transporter permease [Caproicibacter fermentans]
MRQKKLKNVGTFLIFGGPSLFAFTAVVLIPLAFGLYLTFTNWNMATGTHAFIGLGNYKSILTDKTYLEQLWFTIKYALLTVVISNVGAFSLGLILSKGLKGQTFFRTGFFTPNLIGGLILGYLWQFLFTQVLPFMGQKYGWAIFQTSWLSDTTKAFWALVIVNAWQLMGYLMIVYIAGFVSVPSDILEAAAIDGAGRFRKTISVILPLSVSSIVVCLFLSISRSFLTYDLNLALTNGGPYGSTELASFHIVQKAFLSNEYGMGQAEAVILFIVVAVIALTQSAFMKRLEVEA